MTSALDGITEQRIRETVGALTFERGAEYQRRGRVRHLQVISGRILAEVDGSEQRPYHVLIRFGPAASSIRGTCTCPVGADCKHVAAAALTALRQHAPVAEPGVPPWERRLRAVLADDDQPKRARRPLGLQLEAVFPGTRNRYVPDDTPVRFRIRPVTVGRRGEWVRTGISWRELEYASYGDFGQHPGRGPILELLTAMRSGANGARYGYVDFAVHLDDGGMSTWYLLDDLADAKVPLVFGKSGAVDVVRDPVTVGIDVHRDGINNDAELSAKFTGADPPPESAQALGRPAIGLWSIEGGDGTSAKLRLWRFARKPDLLTAGLIAGNSAITIPATDLDRFTADYLPRVQRLADVGSTDGSVNIPELIAPGLLVQVDAGPNHMAELTWYFSYPTDGADRLVPMISDLAARVPRDHDAEESLLDDLDLSDPRLGPIVLAEGHRLRPRAFQQFSGMQTAHLAQHVLPALRELPIEVEVIGELLDYRESTAAPVVELSVTDQDGRDWFDLSLSVTIDGIDVPFGQLFTALATGSELLLPNGIYLNTDRPELHELRHLIDQAKELVDPETGTMRLEPVNVGLWEHLVAHGVVAEQSERWRTAVRGLLDLADLPTPEQPAGLLAELRPYQLTGFHWLAFLWESGLGGILADDMGLGKTVQALTAILHRKHLATAKPVLVVAPTSVVAGWAGEAQRFTPDLRIGVVSETGARRSTSIAELAADVDVLVTSYALLRLESDGYERVDWGAVLLDEAQAVKNYRAKGYQAVRRLRADIKVAITGTPLENNLMELWALLSITAPGLFPDPEKFTEQYRNPIERGTDPAALGVLRQRIRPLMLRRTKDLVAADLPPKQEQVLRIELDRRHRRAYDTHLSRERQKVLGLLTDMRRNRFEILQALTKLRQLALSASLVDDEFAGVPSAKIDTLVDHLHELKNEGHRALVFSQFTRFLAQVRTRLDAEGIDHVYLDGSVSGKERGGVVKSFKDGDAPAFLISLKAGGFGLNLTEADYVFVMDPWWNPAAEAQAVDRAHRIGQHRPVNVYRMISADTIEEKVAQLQQAKRDLFSRVIDEDGMLGAALSADDLRGLLD